jgi:hypothetical protein
MGRKPKVWTAVDRDYEQIRINMQTLFRRPRPQHRTRRGIDNKLSIESVKRLGRRCQAGQQRRSRWNRSSPGGLAAIAKCTHATGARVRDLPSTLDKLSRCSHAAGLAGIG